MNACGTPEARQAVADFHSGNTKNTISAENVVIANGCSGALELVLTAMLDEDSVLLVPQPGFPLYQVIAESHGASVDFYRLDPDHEWEIDLKHLTRLIQKHGERVRGVVVNNPSNPTGAVFSLHHLESIVDVCESFKIPIVSDEVYGDLCYNEKTFHPLADVAATMGGEVPVITVSGIGKQYLLPGWRCGWAVFQDNVHGSLKGIEAGAKSLAQVVLGCSHLVQTALPSLLDPENQEIAQWKSELRLTLEDQAKFVSEKLAGVGEGLDVIPSQGAMYVMCRINVDHFDDSVQDDLTFSQALLQEENVLALPGSCFEAKNVFRVVFCPPKPVLDEAVDRIKNFCERHAAARKE